MNVFVSVDSSRQVFGETLFLVFLEDVDDAEFPRKEIVRNVVDKDDEEEELDAVSHQALVF